MIINSSLAHLVFAVTCVAADDKTCRSIPVGQVWRLWQVWDPTAALPGGGRVSMNGANPSACSYDGKAEWRSNVIDGVRAVAYCSTERAHCCANTMGWMKSVGNDLAWQSCNITE